MKKVILIGCGGLLALGVVIVVIALVAGLAGTAPMKSAADDFLTALQKGDWDTAYALCDPSLKSEVESASNLGQLVLNGQAQPEEWTFMSRSVDNGQGEVQGDVTMTGGVEGTVSVRLIKGDDGWKVVGFNLQPK